MDQINANRSEPAENDHSAAAAGINPIAVLIVLAVLVALVAALFWALPAWFGSSNVNINIRR